MADTEAPFPTISAFPSLEALYYSDSFYGSFLVEPALFDQLLTFASHHLPPVPPSCLVLYSTDLASLRGDAFEEIATTGRFADLAFRPEDLEASTLSLLRGFAATLRSLDRTSIRLSRVYLPPDLFLKNSNDPTTASVLANFIDALACRQITVIFEAIDTGRGGQNVSQDFLEYAKEERRIEAKKDSEKVKESREKQQ
jgi:hypothetical protein